MRGLMLLQLVLCMGSSAVGDDDLPATGDAAIDRGVAFLIKDAQAWKADKKCASCHHAALVVWALDEAKVLGRPVDEQALGGYRKWIAESGDGRTSVPRPEGRPKAFNSKALSFSLGMAAGAKADDSVKAGLAAMIETVKSDQAEDGSWVAWPETRPPIFGPSDDSVTAFGTLAMQIAVENGDDSAKAHRDRGLQWLSKTPTDDDPQSVAMRTVVFQRAGQPADQISALVERIKSRQNSDGGWSQTADMASDAWATGQALYALSTAGLKSDETAVSRGREFLVRTQNEDGSWKMASRPIKYLDPKKPGGNPSGNLVPIIGAGSAWAVIGLARSG
jgi:hypothetical protein